MYPLLPLLPLLPAAGLLLLLSGMTTAGLRGGASPESCFCGRLTATADAAGEEEGGQGAGRQAGRHRGL
jgi:hypothetical protein